jgi:UDPglucose--hexose-1-phosphate uridylyltransferase
VTVTFKTIKRTARFLDPADNYKEKSMPLEYRIDPLTKELGLVRDVRFMKPLHTDIDPIIEKSLEGGCPFCSENINQVTPKFIPELCPEGRLSVGEATVLPNMNPYMEYGAVTVISTRHVVRLTDFTPKMLSDALTASQQLLKNVHKYDPKAVYCGIMCNYFPPANSSQVHPHLQVYASHFPMTYQKRLLDASKRYFKRRGSVFWADLIKEEKRRKERFIASIGNTVWLTSFVPRSYHMDVRAIFRSRASILKLTPKDFQDFAKGLVNVFKYLNEEDHYSFNMFIYSGMMGEKSFWTQARVIQRGPLTRLGISDAGNATLLGDTMMSIRTPEFVCKGLRSFF